MIEYSNIEMNIKLIINNYTVLYCIYVCSAHIIYNRIKLTAHLPPPTPPPGPPPKKKTKKTHSKTATTTTHNVDVNITQGSDNETALISIAK